MEFELKPSEFFLEQIEELSDKVSRIVEDKLRLLKINPFRFKRIEGYNLFLFRKSLPMIAMDLAVAPMRKLLFDTKI